MVLLFIIWGVLDVFEVLNGWPFGDSGLVDGGEADPFDPDGFDPSGSWTAEGVTKPDSLH